MAEDTSHPDTGTTRGDVTEQIKRVSAFYASPIGSVFAQLLANAMQDPAASERLGQQLRLSRRHGIDDLWSRAVARGDVRVGIDPDIAMDVLFGPVIWPARAEIFRHVTPRALFTPTADQLCTNTDFTNESLRGR